MRTLGVLLALITTAMLASACQPPVPCPAIAQAPVVALTVAAGYVPNVRTVHLKACQDGTCKEADLELFPGSTAVDQGCEPVSNGPDGVCSATSSPDGTLTGMLMLDVLTESPIDVTARVMSANGSPLPERKLNFTPRAGYPYGEQCGKFITAGVVLDADGLRPAR
jgi:hypothetical protein